MTVTGIIAEYNPFHNGHLYHLKRARHDTNADYIVIVMSGDFVQRGAPAIVDKYVRTRMALEAGADLVIELPVYYAVSSADYFARGATVLMDKLGVVNCLSFGSEHGRIEDLAGIAALSSHETPAYSVALNRYLVEGKNFAYANTHALMDACEDAHLKTLISEIMSYPNNTLGISYIRSLMNRGSSIIPHTVYRAKSEFDDDSPGAFSATSVRSELMRTGNVASLSSQVPDFVLREITANYRKTFPLTRNDFSAQLLYKLRYLAFQEAQQKLTESKQAHVFSDYLDVGGSLARRIIACMNQYDKYKQFTDLLKTRNLTYVTISRALMHLMLDIRKDLMDTFIENDYIVSCLRP